MAMSKQQQGDPVGFLDLVGPDLSACVFARLADPADLARATTVSRPWRRFVEGNGFLKKVLGLPRRCSGVWRPPSCRRRSSPPPQGPRSSHHGHSRASRSSSSLSWPMIDERRQIRRQGQGGGMREGQRKVPALARRLSVPPPPGRPAARGFSRAVRPEDDPFLAAYLACTKSSGDGGKEKTGGAAREPKGQRRFTWGLGVLSCKRANGVVEQSMGRYRWSSKAALNTTDLVGGWADKALCLLLLPMSSLEERMMVKQQRMMVPGHGERGSAKIDRWLPPVVWIWGIFQAGQRVHLRQLSL